MNTFFRDPKYVVILSYLLLLIPLSKWGLGMSPDSVGYWSVAESLVHGNGFVQYDGTWMTNWPWLFPLLLSPFVYFPYLFTLFQIALALFSYTYLAKKLASLPLKWFLASLFVFPAFVKLYVMLWSEAVFIALLIPFFILYQKQEKSSTNEVVFALLGVLICELRYAGIPLVVGLLIWEGIQHKRITRTSIYLLISLIPVALNLWWNSHYEMTIVSNNTKGHQLHNFIHNYTQQYTTIIGFTLLAIFLFVGFTQFKNVANKGILFAFVPYWLVVLCFAPLKPEECLRYALPMLPILIKILDDEEILQRFPIKTIQLSTLCLVQILVVYVVYMNNKGTGGFNKITWNELPLRETILSLPQQRNLVSNAPDLVYYQTHQQTKLWNNTYAVDSNTVLIWINEIDRNIPFPSNINLPKKRIYAGFNVYTWK